MSEEKSNKKYTDSEWVACQAYKRDLKLGKVESISTDLVQRMFKLYLNGMSHRRIAEHWASAKITEGAVVCVSAENGWPERREAYLADLHDTAVRRVNQSKSEAAEFLGDMLAVAHKKHGQALKQYLMSGKEEDLDGFEIGNLNQYRAALTAFLELTDHKPSEFWEDFAKNVVREANAAAAQAGATHSTVTAFIANLKGSDLSPQLAAALLSATTATAVPVPKPVETVEMPAQPQTIRRERT